MTPMTLPQLLYFVFCMIPLLVFAVICYARIIYTVFFMPITHPYWQAWGKMTTPTLVERSEILAGLDALRFVLQQSPVDPRFNTGYLTALNAVAQAFRVSQEFEATAPPAIVELPRLQLRGVTE